MNESGTGKPDSIKAVRPANFAAVVLFAFGLMQIAGYLLNLPVLKGIGAAFLVSPMPKVFSDVNGLETFASEFYLILTFKDGSSDERRLTPEIYAKLRGPYNRRNVYGAALSYAPRLPENLWKPVFQFGFSGPLREELGLPAGIVRVQVKIVTKTRGRNNVWVLG